MALGPQAHKPARGHSPTSALLWALVAAAPLSSSVATGAMPASLEGSSVTPKCIPWGQLGIPLQVDLHRAMSKGHFPSHPGTDRAPAEYGQAWGGRRGPSREALVPIPRGCGDARGTISLGDCLHRSLRPDSAGFVTTGRRSSCMVAGGGGGTAALVLQAARGHGAAVPRVEACPPASAGSQDLAQSRPWRAGL